MRSLVNAGCVALILLMTVAISACGTKRITISSEQTMNLKSNTFTVVHYNPEPFMIWRGEQKARSAALMMFGAIGGAIEGRMQIADAKEEGAKYISQTQLTDPIKLVETRS